MAYMIQGQAPPLPREPVEMNGVTYVPLRDVTETLGGKVDWDNEGQVASATIAQWCATVPLGSETSDVNGTTVAFSAPAVDQDGTLWVPADFFHSAFGYVVQANGTEVSIVNPNTG